MNIAEVNDLIEWRFKNPVDRYIEKDGTYPSLDIYAKVRSGEWDLKMLACYFRQEKKHRFDVDAEELYKISPDFFGEYRIDWGRGENSVTDQLIKEGKITRDFSRHFKPQLDHFNPLSKSKIKTIDNLVWRSEFVNRYKNDLTKDEYLVLRKELDEMFDIK